MSTVVMSNWLHRQLDAFHSSTLNVGRHSSAGFRRAAARFYIISKPFWCAAEHARGFHYYGNEEHEDHESHHQTTASSNNSTSTSQTIHEDSIAENGDAEQDDADSIKGDTQPHFRHTKLNSSSLMPRAARSSSAGGGPPSTGSNRKTITFSSPTSSPFLTPAQPTITRTIKPLQIDTSSGKNGNATRATMVTVETAEPKLHLGFRAYNTIYHFFHLTPRRIAWSWSLLMIALLVICTYLNVYMSYCHRNMSTSLGKRDADAFYTSLTYYFAAILIASPLLSISQYAKSQLSMHWRIYLTNKILQEYFQHRNYYYLQSGNGGGNAPMLTPSSTSETKDDMTKSNGHSTKRKASKVDTASSTESIPSAKKSKKNSSSNSIDNPDQRIADDIRAFTRSSLTFMNELLDEVFQVLAFAGILYSISPILVFGLILYAVFGTYLATSVFGLRLIAANSKQSKLEADFRFSLVRVRTNAEAIAFYSGEHAELSYIYWRFSKIVRNLSKMSGIQCNLALFKHGYGFLTYLIPPFFLAPLYFNGQVELGVISQASMAFGRIFNSLNMVVSKMNELSKWRSGMERIWELEEALRKQDQVAIKNILERRRSRSHGIDETAKVKQMELANRVCWSDDQIEDTKSSASTSIQVHQSNHLYLDHLMVCVQGDASEGTNVDGTTDRILVKNLTLFLPSLQSEPYLFPPLPPSSLSSIGRGLLIMGRSGIGKSTLLRAIGGLWKHGRGTIYRPNLSSLLFLPQRPYMILGTLRQQLLYPFCPESTTSNMRSSSQMDSGRSHENSSLSSVDEENTPGDQPPMTPSTYGIRRRWPVSNSAYRSPLTSPTAGEPPSPSPSPPPPTSSGTLDQSQDGIPTDEDLEHILKLVNLAHLTKPNLRQINSPGTTPTHDSSSSLTTTTPTPTSGLDVLCDWSEVLSLGEAQRIAFARILIHQPRFVFCDEITAALDAQNEEKLYSALSTYAPQTCLVSVGHRATLLKHHSHVLHLQEQGQWTLLEINEANQTAIDHITAVTTTT